MAQETPQSRIWRKLNGIEPWCFTVPVKEVHRNVRMDVRKKQSRIDLLKESYNLFGSADVATVFRMATDYYSNIGLVLVNEETREYKRVSICSRWNLKHDSWYKKRYYDMKESLEGVEKACMISIGYDQKRMYQLMLKSAGKGI